MILVSSEEKCVYFPKKHDLSRTFYSMTGCFCYFMHSCTCFLTPNSTEPQSSLRETDKYNKAANTGKRTSAS